MSKKVTSEKVHIEDEPILVRNVSKKPIPYGGRRRRVGENFYITRPEHFSKVGHMVRIDKDGREIRHLGGHLREKDAEGKVIRETPLRGKPVPPGEEPHPMSDREAAEAKRVKEAKRKLEEAQKELAQGGAPPVPLLDLPSKKPLEPVEPAASSEVVVDPNVI